MNIFNKNENQKIKINFEIIKNNNNTNNNNNNNNNINFFQEKTNERKLTDIILYDSLIKILSDCIKNNNNNNNDFDYNNNYRVEENTIKFGNTIDLRDNMNFNDSFMALSNVEEIKKLQIIIKESNK